MHRNCVLACYLSVMALACSSPSPVGDTSAKPAAGDAASQVAAAVDEFRPLYIETARTWYAASISGSDADFAASKQAELAFDKFLSDPEKFAKIRALRDDKSVTDPTVRRQIELLFLNMLGKQVAPDLLEQITTLGKQVEQIFNTYRGQVDGKPVTNNEIVDILGASTDSTKLRAAWEAQKGVGPKVAPKLSQLVTLRNQVARELGFRDYYALRLAGSELDEDALIELFDELDRLTREPFLQAKAEVDRRLAKRLGIAPAELMPWHYQNPFFQEPPNVFNTGLDEIYKRQDTLKLSGDFFVGIELGAADIIARSDLYDKPGKTPHAFATDIDREGEQIYVLANIVPGLRWQSVMVHELGHAVYDKYIDRELPWLLRSPTHALTTEGAAMMLDFVVKNPLWAEAMGVMTADQREAAMAEANAYQAFSALQFSRWCQVMLRFERAMYRDPGQDLSKLWWDLVEEYQALKRPKDRDAPDYASKIHLVVAPVYYQNYMLGQLFAAQVHEAIARHVGKDARQAIYVGDPRVGAFLKDKVFGPGSLYHWNELTRRATGSELTPAAFARRFQ